MLDNSRNKCHLPFEHGNDAQMTSALTVLNEKGVPKMRHNKKLIKMDCMQKLTTWSQDIRNSSRHRINLNILHGGLALRNHGPSLNIKLINHNA